MLTIYGDRGSGNCRKVAYVAAHLGLPYEWVDVDIMAGESRTPGFLARSPAGQVPVVRLDDGRHLAQSNAIMLHLAEGSALVPADRFERAKMMEWLFWEQYSHEPNIATTRYHKVYLGRSDEELDPEKVERGHAALALMEGWLARHEWLAGEGLTLADIALLAYTRLAPEGSFDLEAYPAVRAWIGRVEAALRVSDLELPA
jgi:glutathione S-transferase